MIIKFYDNEEIEYPFVEIKDEGYLKFENLLKRYHKEDDYNFDDFISLIEKESWFVKVITYEYDKEVYF